MNDRSKSKKRKSKAKPPTEKKKDCKEVALQVAADVSPPAESPKSETLPVPMDSSASPARSIPSRGPQCFKCQRWGHVSYVCKHDTRCVKCALGHRASQCPKKAVDPCCCANCGKSHPASYRGCNAAPKTRRRRRKPKTQQQDPGKEKGVISKLANVLCKLMITKDFFTEAQLNIISQELDDEKPKVSTSHASTQTDFGEPTSREQGKAEEEPQPLPMETSSVPQAPPNQITFRTVETSTDDFQPEPMETVTESSTVKTNSTWSQTEPSQSNSVASLTPRDRAPPTQHPTESPTPLTVATPSSPAEKPPVYPLRYLEIFQNREMGFRRKLTDLEKAKLAESLDSREAEKLMKTSLRR